MFMGVWCGPLSAARVAGVPAFGPGAARTAPGGGPAGRRCWCSPAGSSSSPTSNVSSMGDPDADLNRVWVGLVERYQTGPAPAGTRRAGLGGEDPPRGGARLLPELPVRGAVRLPARGDARRPRRRRRDRPGGPGRFLAQQRLRPGRVEALGPSGRGRDRRAAARPRISPPSWRAEPPPSPYDQRAAMEFNLADLVRGGRRRGPRSRGAGLRASAA